MGTLTIFWTGKGPTVLKGVSVEEGNKASRNFNAGEALFIHYSPVAGVTSVYGTDRINEISGLGYQPE
jgi:hypothetical protein